MGVCLNPILLFFVIHTTLWSVPLMNSQLIFTALASNIHTFLTSSPSPKVPFFPITYQYHILHSSPHTQPIFFPYKVFECCHNIRNQPVSKAIPPASSFRDITMIGTHQHLGEILKDKNIFKNIFFFFQGSIAYRQTQHRQILFYSNFILFSFIRSQDWFPFLLTKTSLYVHLQQVFLFINNLRILSFNKVRFSLCPIQTLKHFRLPKHLPMSPTNNRIILLPISTDKEPIYLQYFIDIFLNIVSQ